MDNLKSLWQQITKITITITKNILGFNGGLIYSGA